MFYNKVPFHPVHFITIFSSGKLVFCEIVFDGGHLDCTISLHVQSIIRSNIQLKEAKMDMWLVLYWTGPIGVGIFLVCLGAMIYLISKADEKSKHTKAFAQEKGLEKKK
jgi:hypothetical protein